MSFKEHLQAKQEQQAIFNRVASHLLKQGAESKRVFADFETGFGEEACAYRGEEGRMCAVGVLIADEHYYPELERLAVCRTELQQALAKSGIDAVKHQKLLLNLQDMHDCFPVTEWSKMLISIAQTHGLDFNVVTEFENQ